MPSKRNYYRKIRGPKIAEPYARTIGSGYRFWNPKLTTPGSKQTYPFEVYANGYAEGEERCILCRIEIARRTTKKELMGTMYHYTIRLWVLDRDTLKRDILLVEVFGKEIFPDTAKALRSGGSAAFVLYEQLTRSGINRREINSSISDWMNRRMSDEERSSRRNGEEWHQEGISGGSGDEHSTAATGADSVPTDDRRERRPMGDAREDQEKQVEHLEGTRRRRVAKERLSRL